MSPARIDSVAAGWWSSTADGVILVAAPYAIGFENARMHTITKPVIDIKTLLVVPKYQFHNLRLTCFKGFIRVIHLQ
ncbi:MAG: hypothetical protein C0392_12880 [Syntrophus sp. (in: bacteria)]|nr:hypothetical protein [Syntrophus sp. (in: bacteria)]